MKVFAWVLWSVFLCIFFVKVALVFGGICALNDGREIKMKANIIGFLFDLAVFVFLNIYLFV